jgi:hypothetical protein
MKRPATNVRICSPIVVRARLMAYPLPTPMGFGGAV